MADIFISYARADKARAAPIVALLVSRGWTVWWDPEILPGDTYRELIAHELSIAKCILVLWSVTSVKSHWVRDEAEKGRDANRFIPILLDDVEQPLGFGQIHVLNFTSWNYKEEHPAAQTLIEAVKKRLGTPIPHHSDANNEDRAQHGVGESDEQASHRPSGEHGHANTPQDPPLPSPLADQSDVLLGIAIDTSGSMQGSINNESGRVMSRLESVQEAIRQMGTAVQDLARSDTLNTRSFRIFAYAFGLRHGEVCDLISMVRASKDVDITAEVERLRHKYEEEARRSAAQYGDLANLARSYGLGGLVDSAVSAATAQVKTRIAGEVGGLLLHNARQIGDSIATPQELVDLLGGTSTGPQLSELEPLIYGSTPMAAAANQILERFKRIPTRSMPVAQVEGKRWLLGRTKPAAPAPTTSEQRFLLIISDGEPTDGDPRANFNELKRMGVGILSCFVTSTDIADPRSLMSKPDAGWTAGARLMWDAASEIDPQGEFAHYLVSQGWKIQRGARLFIQANHSTVISEFIRVAGTYFGRSNTNLPAKGV